MGVHQGSAGRDLADGQLATLVAAARGLVMIFLKDLVVVHPHERVVTG